MATTSTNIKEVFKIATGFSIVLSVLLIVFGGLAILLPVETSLGVVIVISWLLIISGVVQFVHAFRCKGVGSAIWRTLIAVVYFATGLYLQFNLRVGLAALTLCLILFFLAQGVIDILMYLGTPKRKASGWLLLEGAITVILAIMIWKHWPTGSLWVVGALVGINMMMNGVTRLMLTMAIRRAMSPKAQLAT
jgi:uncharacterized membrane protein HdeD (DUF308 family)